MKLFIVSYFLFLSLNIIKCKHSKSTNIILKYNSNQSQVTFYRAGVYSSLSHIAFPISGKLISIKNLNTSTDCLQIVDSRAESAPYITFLIDKLYCNASTSLLSTASATLISNNSQQPNTIKNMTNLLVIMSDSVSAKLLETSSEYTDIYVKLFVDNKIPPAYSVSFTIMLILLSIIITVILVSVKKCIVRFENYRHKRNIKFLEVLKLTFNRL